MKRIVVFLALIVFSVFINSSILSAKEIGDNVENNLSNEKEEIIIDKNKKIELSNSSIEDIFGDEQTFPFVAGLGKNAAH
tara:strand:+ start:266 stop:505 length:240 start_codon:yes stop_codon:yes gene_type:complete